MWSAPTTTDRDRKELLRTLLEEVASTCNREEQRAELTLRWRGGAITELAVELARALPAARPHRRGHHRAAPPSRRALPRRHHRRHLEPPRTTHRHRRTLHRHHRVSSLRHHWTIPRHQAARRAADGELVTITEAAKILGVVPSTVHRWLADGFIAGEQLTPGAPWRIRVTDDLRARFVDEAPPGWLAMLEATHALGVSRQTVLQRVKRGELEAVHVRSGRRKGLRIKVNRPHPDLFDHTPAAEGAV